MSALESVVVVVSEQPQVVQLAGDQLLVIDGPAPVQIVEVPGVVPDDLVLLVDETLTLLTVAEQGPAGVSDAAYVHSQAVAASVWTAAHNLGKYPAVTVTDNLYAELLADVSFPTLNTVQVAFSSARNGFVFFS